MSRSAIADALEALNQPDVLPRLMRKTLPPDTLELIKCAATDRATLSRISAERRLEESVLIEASRHYLQHVITSSHSDGYRALGLSSTATSTDIQNHRRWLLKWLHPDRNPSKWETQLFQSVEKAAHQLIEGKAESEIVAPKAVVASATPLRRATTMLSAKRFADVEIVTAPPYERFRPFAIAVCLAISLFALVYFGLSEWQLAP
jgi:hypothetical protein